MRRPADTSRPRAGWPLRRRWNVALDGLLFVAVLGCGGPKPSREPLGWGPLLPGARTTDAEEAPKRSPRRKQRPTTVAARTSAADGGVAAAASSGPAPAGSAGGQPGAGGAPSTSPEKSTAASAKAFDGEYRGEDTAIYRMRGMPERTERDPGARTRAKSTSEGAVDFVLIDSSNGSDICTLSATFAGGVATITPGQRCFEQSGQGVSVTGNVTRGTATLDGTRLRLEASLDVEMDLGDTDLSGTLEYRFQGTRR